MRATVITIAKTNAYRRNGVALLLVITLLTGLLATPASAAKRDKHDRTANETTISDPAPTTTTTEAPEEGSTLSTERSAVVADEPAIAESALAAVSDSYDEVAELGSMYNVVDQIGARELWQQGITGKGIDIAVIDTGVAPVAALSGADKVVAMVDLSFEAGIPEAHYLDTNGHGTHMTGIIAGRDPGAEPATAHERPDEFVGVAPGAGIVSVKVGDNTGAVDVSQVIAAVDWVVEHRNEGDLNIRVINLSYGTDSSQDYRIDPLARVVENAWEHGIVVVAASGNDGWMRFDGMSNPAADPYIIGVGAAEATSRGMTVPSWSGAGDFYSVDSKGNYSLVWDEEFAGRTPDVIAPGSHIASLRAPGSRVDAEHPEGAVNDTLFRGSGTSQAAAVVSGSVALLLEARPDLNPDEVKALLRSTAHPVSMALESTQGQGVIDIAAAVGAGTPKQARQRWERSTGLGSLEAARGTQHVTLDGVVLDGEITAFGNAWDPEAWVKASTLGASWTGALGLGLLGLGLLGLGLLGLGLLGLGLLGLGLLGLGLLGLGLLGLGLLGLGLLGLGHPGLGHPGLGHPGLGLLGPGQVGADDDRAGAGARSAGPARLPAPARQSSEHCRPDPHTGPARSGLARQRAVLRHRPLGPRPRGHRLRDRRTARVQHRGP